MLVTLERFALMHAKLGDIGGDIRLGDIGLVSSGGNRKFGLSPFSGPSRMVMSIVGIGDPPFIKRE